MLYTKRQTYLLEESIKKWEASVDGTGTENCALCLEYYYNYCKGCPVAEFTGSVGCEHTPYWDWVECSPHEEMPYVNTNNRTMSAAKAELDFLKMLLERTILFRDCTL